MTIAFRVDFEDYGMMNEAVDRGDRHRLVRKISSHLPNGWLADISAAPLVAS
jgi:hypothetical protein